MEQSVKGHDVILLLDRFSKDSHKLILSFQMAGYDCPAVVIEDYGFLPPGVTSLYGYFLGNDTDQHSFRKPRFFNQIKVPEFWEIRGNFTEAKVFDLKKQRAKIVYTKPSQKRLVSEVQWMDENGHVFLSEHYNEFGNIYANTMFDLNNQRICRITKKLMYKISIAKQ